MEEKVADDSTGSEAVKAGGPDKLVDDGVVRLPREAEPTTGGAGLLEKFTAMLIFDGSGTASDFEFVEVDEGSKTELCDGGAT